MGRAKLRMELIQNEKSRKRAFEKRKKALEKSASELSILCGVDVGMIVYDPFGGSNAPSVWPNKPQVLQRLIESYKSSWGFHDTRNKTYNLSDFFKDQTEKIKEEIKKIQKKNDKSVFDERINSMSWEELKNLVQHLKGKIIAVRERIQMIKASRMASGVMVNNNSVQESRDYCPKVWNFKSSEMVPLQSQIMQPFYHENNGFPVAGNVDPISSLDNSLIIPSPFYYENNGFPVAGNVDSMSYDNLLIEMEISQPLCPVVPQMQFVDHNIISGSYNLLFGGRQALGGI